jgi:hypothetical protein
LQCFQVDVAGGGQGFGLGLGPISYVAIDPAASYAAAIRTALPRRGGGRRGADRPTPINSITKAERTALSIVIIFMAYFFIISANLVNSDVRD